jgi:acyl carrier protein
MNITYEKNEFMKIIISILDGISRRKGFDIKIKSDTKIFDKKILDSIGFVEFITTIETDLNVDIPDHRMSTEYFLTPESITDNFCP